MPPVRYNPSQRVRGHVSSSEGPLSLPAEVGLTKRPRKTFQKQYSSLVWNGQHTTPSAQHLLLNDVDASHFHSFSPVHVNSSDHVFDPPSSLPLPPRPASLAVEIGAAPSAHVEVAASDPFPSPSSSATLSLTFTSPIYESHHHTPTSSLHPQPAIISQPVHAQQSSAPRPANQYMLYKSDYLARISSLNLSHDEYSAFPRVHDQWVRAPENVKAYYQEMARLTKDVHRRLHPDYKYKPRKKDQLQREKAEKARLKEEIMAVKTAVARRGTKVKAKSPPSTSAKFIDPEHPSSPPNISVDVRMYNPTSRRYFRPLPFVLGSPPPLLPHSPSPSRSSPPAPSGVQNIVAEQCTPDSSYTTSPTSTLYQVDASESPRFEERGRHPTPEALDTSANATIEQGVHWYQAAPPHWCGPDEPLLFQSGDSSCYNSAPMSWSDDLHIGIPMTSGPPAGTIPQGQKPPGHSLVEPLIPAPFVCASPEQAQTSAYPMDVGSANNVLESVLVSTAGVNEGNDKEGLPAFFCDSFSDPLEEHSFMPYLDSTASISPTGSPEHLESNAAYQLPIDCAGHNGHYFYIQPCNEQARLSSTSSSGATTRYPTPALQPLSSSLDGTKVTVYTHKNAAFGYAVSDDAAMAADQHAYGATSSSGMAFHFAPVPGMHWSYPTPAHIYTFPSIEPCWSDCQWTLGADPSESQIEMGAS